MVKDLNSYTCIRIANYAAVHCLPSCISEKVQNAMILILLKAETSMTFECLKPHSSWPMEVGR